MSLTATILTVKFHDGKLAYYSDHKLVAKAPLTDQQKKQLLFEIAKELRYPTEKG